MRALVEICCPAPEIAVKAFSGGAGRVELCRDIDCGGLTPGSSSLACIRQLQGPVNVLIRLRKGDFVYSPDEVGAMLLQIDEAAASGAAGVVVGALNPAGEVDLAASAALVERARSLGLSVTFHRAIDEAADYFAAFDAVRSLGVDRILTSGGAPDAYAGRFNIARLVASGGPVIMPGKGVTAANALEILSVTGAVEIHGTRLELLNL